MNAYNVAYAAYYAADNAFDDANNAFEEAYEEFANTVDDGTHQSIMESGDKCLDKLRELRVCIDTVVESIHHLSALVTDVSNLRIDIATDVMALKERLPRDRFLLEYAHEQMEEAIITLDHAGFDLREDENTVRMKMEARICDLEMALLIAQTDIYHMRLN